MKFRLVSVSLILFSFAANAQQWLGISSSNYAGTNSVYMNPANIADSRFKCYINLAGGDVSVLNNYASWNAPYSMLSMLLGSVPSTYKTPEGSVIFKNSYLSGNTTEKNYTGFLNAELRGPSFQYTLEKSNISFGLSTRFRLLTNLSNVNLDVARLIVEGTNQPAINGLIRTGNHVAFNVNGMTEIAASVGYVVKEDDRNFFKVGLTVKRINGLESTHVVADNVDYRIDNVFGTKQIVNLTSSKGEYGIVADKAYRGMSIPKAMLGTTAGSGYGMDIGFVYEFRPNFHEYNYREKDKMKIDGTQNKYDFKIGVALLDIGSVNYNNPNYVTQATLPQYYINNGVKILPGAINTVNTFDKLNSTIEQIYNQITPADKTSQFSVALPMALSVNFDYKVQDNIYVSGVVVQSLRSNAVAGMTQPSLIAITPRYETKWVEFSIPFALLNNYQNLTLGLSARGGPIFIGTDNLGALLHIGPARGLDIYAGAYIPIFRKMPKSSISCPNEVKLTFGEKMKSIFSKKKKEK